jgi:hypothetical protein
LSKCIALFGCLSVPFGGTGGLALALEIEAEGDLTAGVSLVRAF